MEKGKTACIAIEPWYTDPTQAVTLYHGDCMEVLPELPDGSVDMVFADPPYFLSNGGITCHAGRMVSVDKGEWDKSSGVEQNHAFNLAWLAECQRVLAKDGTIWVSGTAHAIYSVGFAMQQLGFKILNDIVWYKPNASPNLSCRYFTHSTETLLWAAKNARSKHTFNYERMKELARGKQMRNLWEIPPPRPKEKKYGKHPTQKPLQLLERVLLASTSEGDLVLDPFNGSGTTGVAALRLKRRYVGIETEEEYLRITVERLKDEARNPGMLV